ncbi:hypothetical protein, partial [Metapseudomonas otitidis]
APTPAVPLPPLRPRPADTAPPPGRLGKAEANPLQERKQGPQQLIVDVWGDPTFGGQVQLLDPEGDA